MHFVNAKGILSPQNGMNLYRGCTHGCIYCDSRSRCYHMDHDFEDIEVKENAIELLEKALRSKRKKCMIGTGAMTDPYIPLELELGNVRKALELIYKYGFGVTLQTKSDRILRDLDLLSRINKSTKCVVQMTLTTYDDDLCRKIEPNVCVTSERVRVLKILRDSGIPTVVWLCPILPFINDTKENIAGIMDYCTDVKVYGVICFGMGLTLREGNREYFYRQLDRCFPGLKDRYIYEYGSQYEVRSRNHESLMKLFRDKCDGSGIKYDIEEIFTYLNKKKKKNIGSQMTLWDL